MTAPVDPHEILKIKGPRELQKFLVNEIQEVYRLQGVSINDKHIEVIVRQMLRKVKVTDPGDSTFVIEQIADKFDFVDENERVLAEGGKPATAIPILMGITKAALNTESFISAASFQETTQGSHRCGDQGQGRQPPRPEGERHHRAPDPGRYRRAHVRQHQRVRERAGRPRGARAR